jgi:hypothetical protein
MGQLRRRAKGLRSKTKRWEILEGVVAAIEKSLNTVPGTSVVPNVMVKVKGSDRTRQIDVLVKIPVGSREIRIGIEVRDKNVPLDVTQIEQLAAKIAKLELDRGCIVAASYTAEAKAEATRCGVELRTISEIENPEWWKPTSMSVTHERIELFDCALIYATEHADATRNLVGKLQITELEIEEPSQSPYKLHELLEHIGLQKAQEPELAHLVDQDTFEVMVTCDLPSGTLLRGGGHEFPLPHRMLTKFRIHREHEVTPIGAFQMSPSVTAFTSVSNKNEKQVTIVAQDTDEGVRRFFITVGDSKPKRTQS